MIITAAAAIIENRRVISPATITIENGIIAKISPTAPAEDGQISAYRDSILLPGLTNAHCHLELTALGTLPHADFPDWIRALGRAKTGLDPAAQAQGIRDGVARLAAGGVTTTIDHISADTHPAFYANLPARVMGFGEILTTSAMNADVCHERVMNRVKDFPVPLNLTPHAMYSIPPEILRRIMTQQGFPYSIHIAESRGEEELYRNGTGELASFLRHFLPLPARRDTTPLTELLDVRPNLENTLIVHGNTLSANDMDRLAALKNIGVVHCPGSRDYFGHPSFPYVELHRRGIPVALGTDSLASNDALDMLAEIRRFLECFPATDFWTLINMVTVNALKVLGVTNTGMIKEGYSADIAVYKLPADGELTGVLRDNINAMAVYRAGKKIS